MLAELEWRSLFTQALPDGGVYRYHEVLRSYLQGVLLDEVGDAATHERFRRAGRLLADAGAIAEAFDAFCRAEDWDTARHWLAVTARWWPIGAHAWVDALPASVLVHDPWLLLAWRADCARRVASARLLTATTAPRRRSARPRRRARVATSGRFWRCGSTPLPIRLDPASLLRGAVALPLWQLHATLVRCHRRGSPVAGLAA